MNTNNVFFLNNNKYSTNLYIEDDNKKDLFIIDMLKNHVNVDINIYLQNNCEVKVVISSLNQNFNKVFNVNIYHNGNGSISKCEVFGINKNKAKTSFFLHAYIKKDSKFNDCDQKIKGILLSDLAVIEGKPNLIIDTNNIKAKHALAIGRLNINHLFYLQSKGIKKSDAIKLLLLSFFNVVLYQVNDQKTKDDILQLIFNDIGEIS